MIKSVVTIGLLLSICLNGRAFADDGNAEKKMRLHAGFEHWYSDSFRTADVGLQANSYSLGMNYPLPVSWIEFLLRYDWATIKADPAQKDFSEFNHKHIAFFTAGFELTKILNFKSQAVVLSAMPVGFLLVKVDGHKESFGASTGYTVGWLFDGRTGMFIDTRYQGGYKLRRLDGSRTDTQNDVSIVVGVVTSLL